MILPNGEAVHGEYVGDAAAVQTIQWYTLGKNARTLLANERIVITDIQIIVAAAGNVILFDDASGNGAVGAGEYIAGGDVAANGGVAMALTAGHWCKRGPSNVKVKSSVAGNVTVILHGLIVQG
jgi:hypothetical protein